MLFFGKYEEGTGDVLVLELVGPSLMDIIEQKRFDKFSLKTILLLGIQIVCITNHKISDFHIQRHFCFCFSCIAPSSYTAGVYCSWTTNLRIGS